MEGVSDLNLMNFHSCRNLGKSLSILIHDLTFIIIIMMTSYSQLTVRLPFELSFLPPFMPFYLLRCTWCLGVAHTNY